MAIFTTLFVYQLALDVPTATYSIITATPGTPMERTATDNETSGEGSTTFEVGDVITLDKAVLGGNTIFAYLGSTSDGWIGQAVNGTFENNRPVLFSTNGDYSNNTPIDVSNAPFACFLAGTMIVTPDGERPVETLGIGDKVMVASGEAKPVKWIGHRAFDSRFIADTVLPIRVEAGALADGVPTRDLFVSPAHAMVIDGRFLPASTLVNGATIRRAEAAERIKYFHIGLVVTSVPKVPI